MPAPYNHVSVPANTRQITSGAPPDRAAPTSAAPDTLVLATRSRVPTVEAMAGRFHGNDERIDVESLALTTQA
jgi:hypothetical protein